MSESPEEAVAIYFKNWGRELANAEAARLITWLAARGWYFCRATQAVGSPINARTPQGEAEQSRDQLVTAITEIKERA